MDTRVINLRLEDQINVDDIFPGVRESYSDEPVYIEAGLFEILKRHYGDDLRREMREILYYFFDENGSTMSISGDDLPAEGIQFFLADHQDEQKKKYHMIRLKHPLD
jgi:hypothetical protein